MRAQRGRRTLYVIPAISDEADPKVKDGLAIRNAATRTGQCPRCGARVEIIVAPSPGTVGEARMQHEDWCPALLGGAS